MIWGGNGWLGELGKIFGLSKLRIENKYNFVSTVRDIYFMSMIFRETVMLFALKKKKEKILFEELLSVSIKGRLYLCEYRSMGALYSEASFVLLWAGLLWAGPLPCNFA